MEKRQGSDPTGETRPRTNDKLPSLPREALKRIELAVAEAEKRYETDIAPSWPAAADFSFVEQDLVRARERVLDYIRVLAEDILNARLTEYLEYAPLDLIGSDAIRRNLGEVVWTLATRRWDGYNATLHMEPSRRESTYQLAFADGKAQQHQECEPWRYPTAQGWADFIGRMAKADSPFAGQNERFFEYLAQAVIERLNHYRALAAFRSHKPDYPVEPGGETAGEPENSVEGEGQLSVEALTGLTTSPGSNAGTGSPSHESPRALIDEFILKVSDSRRKIIRKDIWTVAGYKDSTEFERFQRNDGRTTDSAKRAFNRVLGMRPEDFIASLDKKTTQK